VLGVGCWVLGVGFWVLGFGFWVLGFGFWMLDLQEAFNSVLPGRRKDGKRDISWTSSYRLTVLPAN
jgi:hypothetical protein